MFFNKTYPVSCS